MKLLRTLTAGVVVGLLLAVSPGPANAILSDVVVVTLGPPLISGLPVSFEFPFDESVEVPLFLPLGVELPIGALPPHLIVLDEPAAEGGGISDMLLVNPAPNPFCVVLLCFVSDDDQVALTGLLDGLIVLFPTLPVTHFAETGELQDVTPGDIQQLGAQLQIQSDVAVPEPGTLLLLAIGLAGLVVRRLRVTS